MADPNEEFRAARERAASLTDPDDCLSRQELAELVNTWIWKHHNKKKVGLTASYIGKLEQGSIRWPGILYREAFRAIFGVSTDSALGFVNSRRKVVKLDNVKRREAVQTATLLGVGALTLEEPVTALLTLLEGGEPIPIPARVSATDIEQTRIAAEVFQSWSFTYGGGLARETVRAQLRWSAGLLHATCPDRLQPELFSAVGNLADVAAYIALDAGADEEARRVFRFALTCAERAEDWTLRATVLTDMAVQAIWAGQPDEGLTLTEFALVRADDRLASTEQAMPHTDRARALAKMRRVDEALTAIGTADECFGRSDPGDESPLMAYYDVAYHTAITGHALFDLAILGRDHGEATKRLTAAVTGLTTGCARPRARCLTKLATLTMATGDPLHAATIGAEALDTAGTIRSRYTADELRELSRYAAAHQHLDEVAHLRHRIATLVCTDNP
ncbi:MAG: XRE family transcriptional regulator [Pseudonocardiaceae bacterium]